MKDGIDVSPLWKVIQAKEKDAMSSAILGKKIGMTVIFDESGNRIPVTAIQAGPCLVVQKRTMTKDQYSSIRIGFDAVPGRKLNKPDRGLFEKLKLPPQRYLREIRLEPEAADAYKVGDSITVDIFEAGQFLDVTGTSKGRGFQGVVKRYGFRGNTQTRGTHEYRRHPGGIGMREHPGRVLKGKKLPGQMGNKRVTTQNIKLIKVDTEKNLLLVHGAIPGSPGGLLIVSKAVKRKS